ncbi:unnamed protein product [Closterium sp. NIES-53]
MRRWGRRAEGAVGAEGALPWYSQEELRRATGDWRTRLGEGDSPHTPLPRTIPLPPLFLLPVIPHPRPLPTPITSFPPYPHAPVSPHPLPADKELDPVLMRAVGADGALPRYSQEELRRATGDWRTKLGEGGFGAVYKGLLLLPRIGGDGEGDGGGGGDREGDGEDGEEEGEEGVEEGLEGLEVVEVDGKRFVPVAVKMCLTEGDVHGGREQLLTEIMVMTALRHPNVLRLLGMAMWGQTISLVSEFVPGGDVSQRLEKGRVGWNAVEWGVWCVVIQCDAVRILSSPTPLLPPLLSLHPPLLSSSCTSSSQRHRALSLEGPAEHGATKGVEPFPWKDRLSIAVGSVAGLAAIHKEGFIHRDFKAANVLLTKDLVPKVADFGLAKTCQDRTHVTTRVAGSQGYIDPSYFETGILTEHCDTFAWGIFLLELLSGCCVNDRPFSHLQTLATDPDLSDYSQVVDRNLEGQWSEEEVRVFCGFLAGGSDTCMQLIEGLYCAIMCDPGASKYVSVQLAPSGKLADSNGTIRICNDFSNRVYDACQSLAFPGVALTIASLIKNPAKFLSLVVTPLAGTATPLNTLNTVLVPTENGTDSCFLTAPGDKYAQTPLCCDKLTGFPMECPKNPKFSNVSEVLPWVVDRAVPATCAATSNNPGNTVPDPIPSIPAPNGTNGNGSETNGSTPSGSAPSGSAPSGSTPTSSTSNTTGSGEKSTGLSLVLRGGAWWGWWPAALAALMLHVVLFH